MRKALLTTAAILAAMPAFAESWRPDDHHLIESSISEAGGRITYTEAASGTVYGSSYATNDHVTFRHADVHVTFVGDHGQFNNTYSIHVDCNSGNCVNVNNSTTSGANLLFASLAEAQQWAARLRGGGGSAASCQQTSSMHYSDGRSANTVKLTTGGLADGHFYTPDGTVFVVHNSYKDANGLTSWGHTYLEGDNGQIYRLDPGTWKIQPGCYTHRITEASVLGTGSLSSTVFFTDKPVPPPATTLDVGAMSKLGDSYFKAHNYKDAFPLLERAARAGDTRAQELTAFSYQRGLGVRTDWEKALHWWRLAAAGAQACQNCAGFAQYQLGLYYLLGLGGLKADKAAAIEWYRRAAQTGDESAQKWLRACNADLGAVAGATGDPADSTICDPLPKDRLANFLRGYAAAQ